MINNDLTPDFLVVEDVKKSSTEDKYYYVPNAPLHPFDVISNIRYEIQKYSECVERLEEVLSFLDNISNYQDVFKFYKVQDAYELKLMHENMLFTIDGMAYISNALQYNIVNGSTESFALLFSVAVEARDFWEAQPHPEIAEEAQQYTLYGMDKVVAICEKAMTCSFAA